MAGNIKGITIEFRGDTTKLDKALRDINTNTRNLDKELKSVDKALKFNPTNVDLWRQKQQLLTEKVGETKSKLDVLKQAQAQLDAKGVDKNSAEYRKLQREIIETESKVKTFEGQLKKIGNVNLRAASEQFKQYGDKLTAAGNAMKGLSMAAAAVDVAIGALTIKSAKWADDVNTMSKTYGISTTKLQQYSAAAELVDVDVETLAKTNQKLKKSMFSARDGGKTAEVFEELGIAVTDANGNLRDSEEVFSEVLAVLGTMENETERDALAMQILGKSAAELNPLIEDGGETYKNVAETLKKYNLDFISQEDLDNANKFNDEIDTIKTIGLVAFQSIGTQLAGYLAPALEKVVNLVGKVAEWLAHLDPRIVTIIAAVAGVVAAIAPLLLGLGKIAFAISSIMSLMATLGPAIGALAGGPFVVIAAAIAAVIAIGVLLYKNWDKIKKVAETVGTKIKTVWTSVKTSVVNAVTALKNSVVTAWTSLKTSVVNAATSLKNSVVSAWTTVKTTVSNLVSGLKKSVVDTWDALKEKISDGATSIKNALTAPFTKAKEKIDEIIEKIKGFFPIDIKELFSKIKLPHLSVEWTELTAFGKTIEFPSGFDIDWYKNGGIFSSPSIIGVGEAGSEAVVPLDKFWNKLDNLTATTAAPVINIYPTPHQDAREIAKEVEKVLVQQQKQKAAAYGNI